MALIESEERYRKLAATLEEQVEVRTHELQARNADILKQSEEVQNLSVRLLQSQNEERRRIARELHDSAGQILAAISMEHGRIAQRLKAFVPNLPGEMGELEKLTTLLHQEIRTTSYLLHPPTLDASGLSGALRWMWMDSGHEVGWILNWTSPRILDGCHRIWSWPYSGSCRKR